MIVEVALNLPIQKVFDYLWSPELGQDPVPGLRVLVPFGGRKLGGVVTASKSVSGFGSLKKIEKVIEDSPSLTQEILELCRWVASYYFCGWGEVLNGSVPGGLGLLVRSEYLRKTVPLPGSSDLEAALRKLTEEKEIWTADEWQNHEPAVKENRLLGEWIRDGHVEKQLNLTGRKTRPKMQRWVRLLKDAGELKSRTRKKTKKQRPWYSSANLEAQWRNVYQSI